MSHDLVINGVTYNGVKSLSVPNANGEIVQFLLETGGGGLPDGVSALASGTVTPTTDTYTQSVQHGLGVTPNFGITVVETDVSEEGIASMAVYSMVIHKEICNFSSSAPISYINGTIKSFDSSCSYTNATNIGLSSQTIFTDSKYKISVSSANRLKAGHTYRWVCGVIDGIQ